MKKQKTEEYEVNPSTLFLEPVEYGSKTYTKVYETGDEFLSPFKPLDIIKTSCNYFGVDYESRKKGTRLLIGYSRKLPIVIEPTTQIYFFPTTSPISPDCIWISQDHVEKYHRIAAKQTLITFRNKQTHLFPVSFETIEGQFLRTARLKMTILQRIETNKRERSYFLHDPESLKASENPQEYGDDLN